MSLRCRKCGHSFNRHHILAIDDNPIGYRCKSCLTMHSWIDGKPIGMSKTVFYRAKLGSKNPFKIGGERK